MYPHQHQQHQQLPPPQLPPQPIMPQLVDNVSGPLYYQQQVSNTTGYLPPFPATTNTYRSPLPPSSTGNSMKATPIPHQVPGNGGYAHHPSQSHLPAEPIPSTTNTPTAPMTMPQLAEFAAIMTFFLWHVRKSSVMALHSASSHGDLAASTTNLSINQGDTTLSIFQQPTNPSFQRFCQQILTATQVSESVVLLALKYIAKLLQASPRIQGAEGSEYRLFIVALILANKFHDDNTFTNKTWSDISGMKLRELDIMELEFLNVLDFCLFVGKDEFDHWKTGLFTFMLQVQNATAMQERQCQQQMMEAALRSMGIFLPTTSDAAATPTPPPPTQQQYPYYLFNTTAQPEWLQIQPLNTPVTRVPLRIPSYPVYMPTSSASSSIHSTPTSTAHVSTSYVPSVPTPINNAMYHPPPPSQQVYQQQLINSTPVSYTSTPITSQQPSASSTPSSSRPLPRNASTPSLFAWASQSSTRSATPVDQTQHHRHHHHQHPQHHHHHQRAYRPYQRPVTTHHTADHHQSLVDYYAWKSLTEGSGLSSPMNNERLHPSQQQQQQQHRYSRRRSYSNPFPLYHHQQQQQMLKPYALPPQQQQQQQQQLAPHDSNQYQDYQQIGADPSRLQHDHQHQHQQQYRSNGSSGPHHSN